MRVTGRIYCFSKIHAEKLYKYLYVTFGKGWQDANFFYTAKGKFQK